MAFKWFRDDLCDQCGDCFVQCPVLHLPVDEARQEIKNLISGNINDSLAFSSCPTCNLCDFICPENALPYELILENWDQWRKVNGFPRTAKIVFPNEPENMWSAMRVLMDENELNLLRKWEANLDVPRKEIVLTGFYNNLCPHMADLKILEGVLPTFAGAEGLWGCGGDTNKLAMINDTHVIVKLLEQTFERLDVKTVYCFMQAEAAMLKEILPQRYGADFKDVNFEPLHNLVLKNIQEGKTVIDKKLNMTVTVHDNCLSRYLDQASQEVVRDIIKATGCTIVEMKHCKMNALCCGYGASIPTLYTNKHGILNTIKQTISSLHKRLKEAMDTGAEFLVADCPACYFFLSFINEMAGKPMTVIHSLELVEMAAHPPYVSKTPARCWDMAAIYTVFGMSLALSKNKRFFPKPVDPDTLLTLPVYPEKDAARLRRVAALYKSPVVQNSIAKKILGFGIKTLTGA